MPPEGVRLKPREEILSYEEIVELARIFASLGVTKIRLTGGEPLVRRDVELLVASLSEMPGIEEVSMTTNGLLLEAKLGQLKSAGLTRLNVSLDSLRPDRFREIARRPGLESVLAGIHAAVDQGFEPVKVNCVVIRGVNDDELLDFVELGRDRPVHVRFIEYMPFQGNGWSEGAFMSYAEMTDILEAHVSLNRLAPSTNDVARVYQIPGFVGTVGFIASMTRNFCSGCNRLRLTADGHLKACLFGHAEVSLRDALRGGCGEDEIETLIRGVLLRKKAAHDGMFAIAAEPGRPMILIGG